jgi:hypothetical protein
MGHEILGFRINPNRLLTSALQRGQTSIWIV